MLHGPKEGIFGIKQETRHLCTSCKSIFLTHTQASLCDCVLRRRSPIVSKYKSLLAEAFNYAFFVGQLPEAALNWCFLTNTDLKALNSASANYFHFVQPTLRLRCLQASNNALEEKRFLSGNLEVIAVRNGAVYNCSYCSTKYLTRLPCLICGCMLCGRCEQVLPIYMHHFNTSTKCECAEIQLSQLLPLTI